MYKRFLTSVLFVFFMLSCSKLSPFEGKMRERVQTSLSWRNDTTSIWETAGRWNSANILTATIHYGAATKDSAIPSVTEDVFEKTRHYQVGVGSTGTPRYCDSFINDHYDNEGWWALAWIEAFKLTGEKKYLDMAEIIFDDMTTGWSNTCGSGIFWKKSPLYYKNPIANNLFSLTAIRLYKTTQSPAYLDWFKKNVDWYMRTGMINMNIYQIKDGTKGDCTPNRNTHYTYNQGVIVAVLAEMYPQTNDKSYLELTEEITGATITIQLITDEGILREMKPEIDDNDDGVQFKSIFIRHLAFLYEVTKNPAYKDFILEDTESITIKDYGPTSKSFGCYQYGPFHKENSAANACALEYVTEAYDLTKQVSGRTQLVVTHTANGRYSVLAPPELERM